MGQWEPNSLTLLSHIYIDISGYLWTILEEFIIYN